MAETITIIDISCYMRSKFLWCFVVFVVILSDYMKKANTTKDKMPSKKICFVPTCLNSAKECPLKLFLMVPLDVLKRRRWCQAVGISSEGLPRNLYCCEDHFTLSEDAENWIFYKIQGSRIILKDDVVPHLFLDKPSPDKNASQLTPSSRKRKGEHMVQLRSLPAKKKLFPKPATTDFAIPSTSKQSPSPNADVEIQASVANASKCTNTESTSEDTSCCVFSASSGDPDYEPSTSDEEMVLPGNDDRKVSTILLTEFRTRFYTGLPKETYNLLKIGENIGKIPYVNILIVLKKIRLDDVYTRLADDINLSITRISQIFTTTVPQLATLFQVLIFWPEKSIVERTLPIPFRVRCTNVQSIIDCFEIEIAKPSDPITQSITWSEYKKGNTLKYLISATPNGLINFVSNGFGGRITDQNIVIQSDFLNILPEETDVMADRGFKHVAHLLQRKNCRLIRPPSVIEGEILSKEQAKENKRIAALRIHIERVIRRIREFKMLGPHSCINKNLLILMNCIIIIACGIINMQGPLIK